MAKIVSRGIRRLPLLLEALFWIVLVRVGLSVWSYRKLRTAFVNKVAPEAVPPEKKTQAAWIGWAVRHAARCIPRATCLTQALAAQIMLSRRTVPTTLVLGVNEAPSAGFRAHAWLRLNDRVLLGGCGSEEPDYRVIAQYECTEPRFSGGGQSRPMAVR